MNLPSDIVQLIATSCEFAKDNASMAQTCRLWSHVCRAAVARRRAAIAIQSWFRTHRKLAAVPAAQQGIPGFLAALAARGAPDVFLSGNLRRSDDRKHVIVLRDAVHTVMADLKALYQRDHDLWLKLAWKCASLAGARTATSVCLSLESRLMKEIDNVTLGIVHRATLYYVPGCDVRCTTDAFTSGWHRGATRCRLLLCLWGPSDNRAGIEFEGIGRVPCNAGDCIVFDDTRQHRGYNTSAQGKLLLVLDLEGDEVDPPLVEPTPQ